MSEIEHKPAKKKSTLLRGKHGVRKRTERPTHSGAVAGQTKASTKNTSPRTTDDSLPEQWGWQDKSQTHSKKRTRDASKSPRERKRQRL